MKIITNLKVAGNSRNRSGSGEMSEEITLDSLGQAQRKKRASKSSKVSLIKIICIIFWHYRVSIFVKYVGKYEFLKILLFFRIQGDWVLYEALSRRFFPAERLPRPSLRKLHVAPHHQVRNFFNWEFDFWDVKEL